MLNHQFDTFSLDPVLAQMLNLIAHQIIDHMNMRSAIQSTPSNVSIPGIVIFGSDDISTLKTIVSLNYSRCCPAKWAIQQDT